MPRVQLIAPYGGDDAECGCCGDHVLDLGQDGDGGRAGMDAPAAFGHRHALHPVDAALELQPAEHALAGDGGEASRGAHVGFVEHAANGA